MDWYLKVLKQYADFDGRARRTEYWMFALFNVIAVVVLTVIDSLIGTSTGMGGLLALVYVLALMVPSLAVTVRRLHDTNRSGWWVLINLVPFGGIAMIVFCATAGNPGPNRYGSDPKMVAATAGATY